jgi:uncharacterized protein (DUF2141 family)
MHLQMSCIRAAEMLPAAALAALVLAGSALALGGSYTVIGGTEAEQAQVREALDASAFDWSIVPAKITIHIARGAVAHSTVGEIWLDSRLLDAGRFSWAIVQDEYAHQVDFFLLSDPERIALNRALGGLAWSARQLPGLSHSMYGAERFTSTFVWAYWQSPANAYRPTSARDESASVSVARFRTLLTSVLPLQLRPQ